MGSFTEIVLSFDFRKDTPDHVLAAFAALAAPGPGEGAPALPEPVVEAWEPWSADWRAAGWPEGDPYEHEPWRHDWAAEVSFGAVGTTPHATLRWAETELWNLDCRFSWKTDPETASEALAWLAPYVDHWPEARPKALVGYAHHEYAPRPHLFWVSDGTWELEDLNPDDEWTWH